MFLKKKNISLTAKADIKTSKVLVQIHFVDSSNKFNEKSLKIVKAERYSQIFGNWIKYEPLRIVINSINTIYFLYFTQNIQLTNFIFYLTPDL